MVGEGYGSGEKLLQEQEMAGRGKGGEEGNAWLAGRRV